MPDVDAMRGEVRATMRALLSRSYGRQLTGDQYWAIVDAADQLADVAERYAAAAVAEALADHRRRWRFRGRSGDGYHYIWWLRNGEHTEVMTYPVHAFWNPGVT